MGALKGPVVGGVIQVKQRVKFMREVQSGLWYPWSNVWYVDGVNGNDSYSGRGPSVAKETIQAAVTAASVRDIIYVNPQTYVVGTGHARYEECATIPLATSDLSIIGVGYPSSNEFGVRMKADGTTLYCMDISGPSCHLENIGFFTSSATNTIIVRNNGGTNTQRGSDGITIFNCHFKDATTLIQGGQAARIIDCVFLYASGAHLTIAIPAVSGYNQQIKGCHFMDQNGAQPTGPYINGSGAHTYSLLIEDCKFQQIPSGGKFVVLGGTLNTGLMTKCQFNSDNVHLTSHLTMGGTNMRVVGSFDKTGAAITAA